LEHACPEALISLQKKIIDTALLAVTDIHIWVKYARRLYVVKGKPVTSIDIWAPMFMVNISAVQFRRHIECEACPSSLLIMCVGVVFKGFLLKTLFFRAASSLSRKYYVRRQLAGK
jgi:hypothetical protein